MVNSSIKINEPDLTLNAEIAPWDEVALGYPVAQVSGLTVGNAVTAKNQFKRLLTWQQQMGCNLMSCRLPHDKLHESMFLEAQGFRFIEMVLHPTIKEIQSLDIQEQGLVVSEAQTCDASAIHNIAKTAFTNERFHMDPRINSKTANIRYANWADSVYRHPSQKMIKICDNNKLVAFFVIEEKQQQVYWHLTAVSPEFHGQGYGMRTWLSMLNYHAQSGYSSINTTIAARNTPVLNLYSKLGFRFLPAEMTFHWAAN